MVLYERHVSLSLCFIYDSICLHLLFKKSIYRRSSCHLRNVCENYTSFLLKITKLLSNIKLFEFIHIRKIK